MRRLSSTGAIPEWTTWAGVDRGVGSPRELGEGAAAPQHGGDPRLDDLGRRGPMDGLATEADLPLEGMDQTQDRLHGGGLAGGVAPQQTDQLPLANRKGEIPQDLHWAVARGDTPQLKHGRAAP